jgi:hypothetical protein
MPRSEVTYSYQLNEIMKRILLLSSLLSCGLVAGAFAQSNQSPEMQQSTSTVDTRQANPPRPKMQKPTKQDQRRMEEGLDSTQPKNRKQKRLRPDSLRRGGATRVDTVR